MERARAFARVADEYERGRPGYPPEAIAWLLGPEPLHVVDLGAGTGKLTAALLAAGHHVTAVEPLAEMRTILAASLPDARILDATAEDTGLPDSTADAVVAGAAFHWFDLDRVWPEIARILRAPGVLGLLGNRFDRSVHWVGSLGAALGQSRLGRPGHWPTEDDLRGRFDDVQERELDHSEPVDRARLLDLAQSYSSVAASEEAQRSALLREVSALWDTEPELRGRDTAALPWRTRVRRCRGLRSVD
jgi:SAM-dependent methyltransferase